jgi:hypothetical protein
MLDRSAIQANGIAVCERNSQASLRPGELPVEGLVQV